MTITVRELVSLPNLRSWVLSGSGGLDREVSWAHVSEMPDPTAWLEAGDLVMTTGLGIPEGAEAQRAYVERLADAGLAGLMIGHRMRAPELTEALIRVADEHAFPVLLTSYEVPFASVSRVVAEANRGEEHTRLIEVLRLYETVRAAAATASGAGLAARLGALIGCELFVVEPGTGHSLLPGAPRAPEKVRRALSAEFRARREPMPAVLRLGVGGRSALAISTATSRPAAMLVLPGEKPGVPEPDLSVLRHVSSVLSLEVEKETAEREKRRRLGAELLAGLIDGRLPPESAAGALAERDLGEEPRVIVAGQIDAEGSPDLYADLDNSAVPHLLLRRLPFVYALLPDAAGPLENLRSGVGPKTPIGVSAPLGRLSRAPEARREARWALEEARTGGSLLARYGEGEAPYFLPRNLQEAERAVTHFLGALIDYDRGHGTDLVRSLRIFLAHNRSWRRAAAALKVHPQTLVYRMRRVEEITGRRLDNTDDVATLWFALRAQETSEG